MKRLGEVICIAPWTELNQTCDEKKKSEEEKGEYKVRTEQIGLLDQKELR